MAPQRADAPPPPPPTRLTRSLKILLCVKSTLPVCFPHPNMHTHVHCLFLMHWFFVDTYTLIFYSKFAHVLKHNFKNKTLFTANKIQQNPQNTSAQTNGVKIPSSKCQGHRDLLCKLQFPCLEFWEQEIDKDPFVISK